MFSRSLMCVLVVACSQPQPDVPTTSTNPDAPVCDGVMQLDEQPYVDGPFDADADGFPDADNPECRAFFAAADLDCDDSNPDINPGMAEITCNGVDEDCDAATADSPDQDADGVTTCDGDCADDDPQRSPQNLEICFDEIDNNCDLGVDEQCGPNYNGTFQLDQTIVYSCLDLPGAPPVIDINFDTIAVNFAPPVVLFDEIGDGIQPPLMDGVMYAYDTYFDVSAYIDLGTPLDCDEYYRFSGTFQDEDTFTGTFEVHFDEVDNGGLCAGCTTTYFPNITATRIVASGTGTTP